MKLKNFRPNDTSTIHQELKNFYEISKLRFPKLIEGFYLENNGGRFSTYIIKNTQEPWIAYSLFEYYISIERIYDIDEIYEKYQYLREEASIYVDIASKLFYLNNMIPITDVDSIDCICVCCNGKDTGKIYLVEWISSQSQGILPLPQQLVANSFEELLEKMVLEEDDEEYQRLIRM